MPNYFFSIRDGDETIHDASGSQQIDLAAARLCAEAAARSLLAQQMEAGGEIGDAIFEIRDDSDALVDAFPVRDALRSPDR